tara:strand:+ start:890 stop:1765 length:876 start_codon:yes stop_codon:yes gene_type:complete
MNKQVIFEEISKNSINFYHSNGFVHYRIQPHNFNLDINSCFEYYSEENVSDQNTAFKNSEGKPRHYVDVFRDKKSKAYSIYNNKDISKLINKHIVTKKRIIFTHSKMSFKQIGGDGDWHPHQDSGYNHGIDFRNGFAMFVCLEDMDESNGCLQIYPKSHLHGSINHDRHIEDVNSGDNQLLIKKIPENIVPISIIAEEGDIIIFSPNTIHSSLSTKTDSRRLSLIAEIQEYTSLKLDDYGKVPIFIKGNINFFERLILVSKKIFSPYIYWNFLKKNKKISYLLRKLIFRFE